ncbi:MAG: response regulator transcription factor [Gammaproteobacteria bacterium]
MAGEEIIYVVDDDRRFLAALERSLRSLKLHVKTYTAARNFLAKIEPDRPGCVITDLKMPDMDGIALQEALRERQIRIPIIFITGHGDATTAVTALKGGAVDFLEKPFNEKTLFDSVRQALAKDATDRALTAERSVVRDRYENLSPREREVFALVVSDLPNKEIARRLKISPRTVEHHREHVMLKMQANSLAELITMAVLCGVHELHL